MSQHHFLKRLLFPPLSCLGSFVENLLTTSVGLCFRTLISIPLICTSVLMPVPQSIDYSSFIVNFEIGIYESANFVLFQDYFGYSRSLAF